ncbi:MAG: pyruvate formate lyase-activating protein [Dehalococcoidia bacterium]|nr:MAG: pyruvate formate lyase-activating protein [Dehalococcoidia bacterium]
MRILAIDVGTGTQDILLFDSTGPVENSVKMVMPSATQIAASRVRRATAAGRPVLLTGVVQGGGPCSWAVEDHLRAGGQAFATAEAALTFNDDLAEVEAMGIRLVSTDEAARQDAVEHVVLGDIDLSAVRRALAAFDVSPRFDGFALGCLDHGASPPGYSDRLFRFEHLRRVVGARNDLRAFALLPDEIPNYLTRARAVVDAAMREDEAPVVFLDTGPAAALGALQDPRVAAADEQLVLNLGNMHALAFHLRGTRIVSLYEHHTGELSAEQIVDFSERLVAGQLSHEDVFDSKGHGVFYAAEGVRGDGQLPLVAVTGPQRGKIRGSRLDPYFATPHGDMMISGCFGLLHAFAEKYPSHAGEIAAALTA